MACFRPAAPRFAVVERIPVYDNRDAICGSRGVVQPYRFHTEAGARFGLSRIDPDGWGDTFGEVVDAVTLRRLPPPPRPTALDDDLPF